MRILTDRFTRWHAAIAVVLWLVFTMLTFAALMAGLDRDPHWQFRVAITTAATILGPMTGAISREFQSCCLEASVSLLPYCLSALAMATLLQLIRWPPAIWANGIRFLIWALGLFVWFGGGIVSLAHALS